MLLLKLKLVPRPEAADYTPAESLGSPGISISSVWDGVLFR